MKSFARFMATQSWTSLVKIWCWKPKDALRKICMFLDVECDDKYLETVGNVLSEVQPSRNSRFRGMEKWKTRIGLELKWKSLPFFSHSLLILIRTNLLLTDEIVDRKMYFKFKNKLQSRTKLLRTLTGKITCHDKSFPLSPFSMLLCHQKPPHESSVLANNNDWGEGGGKDFCDLLSAFPYREIEKYAH